MNEEKKKADRERNRQETRDTVQRKKYFAFTPKKNRNFGK